MEMEIKIDTENHGIYGLWYNAETTIKMDCGHEQTFRYEGYSSDPAARAGIIESIASEGTWKCNKCLGIKSPISGSYLGGGNFGDGIREVYDDK